jgi:glycogen debranching enzyme
VGRAALAAELTERAGRARAAIVRRFHLDEGLALGVLPDGTPQRHRTALTAVALLLGAVDADAVGEWFEAIAAPEFSAPWGVRLIATSDRLYDPVGYHSGAVWPLYTGWVSLAEYAHHRAEAGFRHLIANARLPLARQLGAFDEVLRGDDERAAGVCPDQAWSAAMLMLPVVEGLLGARADALGGRLTLAPHLPPEWPACEWRGLRVGAASLDVRVEVGPDSTVVRVTRTGGPSVGVTVAPVISGGREVTEARADETPLVPRVIEREGCRHAAVTLDVSGAHDIEVWYR